MTDYDTNEAEKERLRNSYEDLTSKQASVVDVLVEDKFETKSEAAEKAGVADSYIYYVQDEFSDIIADRKGTMNENPSYPALRADGAVANIDVSFTEDEAFRAVRILPAELSRVVYESIRHSESLADDQPTGLDELFDQRDDPDE